MKKLKTIIIEREISYHRKSSDFHNVILAVENVNCIFLQYYFDKMSMSLVATDRYIRNVLKALQKIISLMNDQQLDDILRFMQYQF